MNKAIREFKDLKSFQNHLRKDLDCPDIVKVGNIIFTMDNYDTEGKEITYGNKRTFKGFSVFTEDRYNKGFSDTTLSEIEETSIRNDIVYQD